ncbi:RNA polymerase sigma-70 factor [Sunxiuqinia sp. A32]|uniref:RNA polymerase sigma-70 factor n=1 Tax=Sunxiuqinia sp. A32 TaxID=3461496 RepID=UPI004045EC89
MESYTADKFIEVYNTYYKKSFLFVKSYVHDDFIAEDIVSESLIKLWKRLRKDDLERIEPFLFTILRNSSLDHLKHEAVKMVAHNSIKEQLVRELDTRISMLESFDSEAIFSSEITTIIRETLSEMSEKTRRVFEMSRFEYMSNKEIAKELGISVKGVDYHIAQSMKQLRVSLKEYLPVITFLI